MENEINLNEKNTIPALARQSDNMQQYYKWHSIIYDATRWSFLWGRKRLIRLLPLAKGQHIPLLEVGCGTGYNLREMAVRFPAAQLTGIDVSADMLARARKNLAFANNEIELIAGAYPLSNATTQPQVIVFSYALTMFNPGWEDALEQAWQDLPSGGYIAVVDFHDTPLGWMEHWMRFNHVRMDGHLLPFIRARFTTVHDTVHRAYGGWWRYFLYIGQKP